MAVEEKLLVILGPTASGKSTLAAEVARRSGAEILSMDSMQVYRAMNIGTAKPSVEELGQIRHHLIDVVDSTESFSVVRFVELADGVILGAKSRGVPLIATGGTPLYYKSLFTGLFEGPAADANVRERLSQLPNDELHRQLTQHDPVAALRIHLNDTRRLVRALEVFELTGRPISSFQTEWDAADVRHRAVWIGLSWDRDELNRRINLRVKEMIAQGWLEETRALLKNYPTLSRTAAEATGYCELIDHIAGHGSLEDAVEQIKIATRQLARRQMKWFRRFSNVHWLAGNAPIEQNIERTRSLWNTAEAAPLA